MKRASHNGSIDMARDSSEVDSTAPDSILHHLLAVAPSNKQAAEPKATQSLSKQGLGAEEQEQTPSPIPNRALSQSYLESLTLCMMDLINAHNFTLASWLPLLAPSFRASIHSLYIPLDAPPHEFVSCMSDLCCQNPEWRCCCTDLSSQVEGRTGEVFLNAETRGIPEGIVTRSCIVLKFRSGRKGWRCVGLLGVNGGAGLDGMGFV